MTMQGHNDHDNKEALQTGRTTCADAVEPCLKVTINLYSRQEMTEGEATQQRMMDDDDNGGDKQQHNNQTAHKRGRRKRGVANGNSINDRINQLTQQSTKTEVNRWGDGDDDNG
jgi:hypothetical protein